MSIATVIGAIYYGEHQRRERLANEAGMINEIKTAMGMHASRSIPIRPRPYSAYAVYADHTAKTPKERRMADLMMFAAKYRESKPGIVVFPAWLSEGGRQRLLQIANRGKK